MKRFFALALAVFSAICFCGCISVIYSPTPTPVPDYLIICESDYTMSTQVVCYPEGATEATAEYIFSCTLPEFNADVYRAFELNLLMTQYKNELSEKVVSERLPLVDKAEGSVTPYTNVSAVVTCVRGIINMFITDSYTFSGESIQNDTTCIVIKNGLRVGLASLSGSPDARARAAQQVINIIGFDNPEYFSGLTMFDVYESIDPINGFSVTEDGYKLLFPANTIADASKGNIEIDIPREALYPDTVGSTVTIAQYETVLPAVNMLATASAAGFESFGFGIAETFTATCFMAQLILNDKTTVENGRVIVDEAAFLHQYSLYFDSVFPGIDTQAHDIFVKDGKYSIYPVFPYDNCYFVLSDAAIDGNIVELTGEIIEGDIDNELTQRVCGATVVVRLDGSTETGFRFIGITLS